jgi:hypothetical protein
VAIATALVPPLCSCGIALAYRQYPESVGALSLLIANVLAIIVAAAITFRMMGLTAVTAARKPQAWVRYVVAALGMCMMILSIPLISVFYKHVQEGKNSVYAYALTTQARNALLEHIEKKPGVQVIFAGRSGIDRDIDPVDIGIILSSKYPLPRSEADEVVELLRRTMENPNLRVMVECVAAGWARESSDDALAKAAESHTQ